MKTLLYKLAVSLFNVSASLTTNFLFLIFSWSSCFSQTISGGYYHSLYVCTDTIAQSCGRNLYGQLGDGTTLNKSTPVQVSPAWGAGLTAVAGGGNHSIFVKNDGTVWSCGFNSAGQLGDGTTINKSAPVQVSPAWGGSITAVAGGERHSLFLKSDGTVWACGLNLSGQLGDGTTITKTVAIQVSGLTGITAVAAGHVHSLFLKNDGTVWACGSNGNGQLGDGTTSDKSTPVQVGGLTGITALSAGRYHSLFLKNDSTVWACGSNVYGQLGDGTTIKRTTAVQLNTAWGESITAVAAGGYHSLFLKNDGTAWACGWNINGQLGDGTNVDKLSPVQVSPVWGGSITAVAAGGWHSLFSKNNNTAWGCGWNGDGQLGDGTGINKMTPVQVTGLCALQTSLITLPPLDLATISIYPNPNNGSFKIQLNNLINTEGAITIKIISLLGQNILTEIISNANDGIEIREESLSKGIYIVKLIRSNINIGQSKLVIE